MPVLECPTCRTRITYASLSEVPSRPFCSRRCQMIDLGKWLNEEYRISEEAPEVDETPRPAAEEETSDEADVSRRDPGDRTGRH